MDNILNTVKQFISIQDWRLVIAGFGMFLIFLLMIYLISLIVLSFQRRRDAVDVKLPDIDKEVNEDDDKETFQETDSLEVELIDSSDDDIINPGKMKNNDDLFLKALSIESKQFIPLDYENLDMPEVGDIDYESIKSKMEAEAEERRRENLERLKKIAKSDEQDLVDMSLINDGGAMDD